MRGSSTGKKEWELGPAALRALLQFLDTDERRAGEQYENIREKLTRFFEWRGCVPGDEYADEAIDRVARRVETGIESPPSNPYLYFHGVALNVIRERWRRPDRDPRPIPVAEPHFNPLEKESEYDAAAETDRRLSCFHDCLDRLPPVSRELLDVYHLGHSGIKIGKRKTLADALSIPSGALRLRLFRIRRQLRACVAQCLDRRAT